MTNQIQLHQPLQAGPQSVGRVLAILDYLVAHRDGGTLSELAVYCDAPKTSLVGLLNALVVEGCITRQESGRYVVGARFMSLAARVVSGTELKEVARPFLTRLMEASGETAVLGTLAPEGDMVVYVDRVESANPIRYAVSVGERRELYCTALGKVLLAWRSKASLDAYLAGRTLKRFTDSTITTVSALRTELRNVREQGMSRTAGERVRDASGVAAPVFLADGSIGGALLIAGPSQRMQANRSRNEALIVKAAAELTEALGGFAPQA